MRTNIIKILRIITENTQRQKIRINRSKRSYLGLTESCSVLANAIQEITSKTWTAGPNPLKSQGIKD